jgi:hypothetical protein
MTMRRLLTTGTILLLCAAWLGQAATVHGQETPAAKATWKKAKTKITVDFKDVRMKDVMDEIKDLFNGRLGIRIDNVSGVSNNTKVTYKAKDQTLEKILNDLSDKYDMGWAIISDEKDRYDGWIVVRKTKERGYEAGKEPKKGGQSAQRSPGSLIFLPANGEIQNERVLVRTSREGARGDLRSRLVR